MKNSIFKNIILLLVIGSLVSCEKRLDIKPNTSIDESQALNTSSDVEAALIGAYARAGDVDVLGGSVGVEAELMGLFGELNWSGTFQELTQMYNKSIPVNNAFVADTWTDSYRAINVTNNVLSAIDTVEESERDRVEGEAKFLRGMIYFQLVKMFARDYSDGDPASNPGVPIVLIPTRGITESDQVGRASVKQVYDLVIQDLTDAKNKLSDPDGFYASTYSASALLARVYLQQGDYVNAATEANRVITSFKYELTDTYAESFPAPYPPEPRANTSEEIFSIQVNTTTGANDFNTYFSSNGRGDIDIMQSYFDLYEPNDDRLNLFYDDGGSIYTGKFENQYGNVTQIRLGEIYLIRAEANFRLRPAAPIGPDPSEDISRIRGRVGLDPISSVNLTLNDILRERKVELAFEGFALDDVKRLKKDVGNLHWDSPKLIFPIPERELLVNKQLSQNEGY